MVVAKNGAPVGVPHKLVFHKTGKVLGIQGEEQQMPGPRVSSKLATPYVVPLDTDWLSLGRRAETIIQD